MPSPRNHRRLRRAFTLIEMLTTVAVLVIVLGLMVSLARDVRNRSADRLTKDLLRRLDELVKQYKTRNLKGLPLSQQRLYPAAFPLIDGEVPDEKTLRKNATRNSRELIRTIKTQVDLNSGVFSDLSIA